MKSNDSLLLFFFFIIVSTTILFIISVVGNNYMQKSKIDMGKQSSPSSILYLQKDNSCYAIQINTNSSGKQIIKMNLIDCKDMEEIK
jgi:hypothetical protein